MFSPVREYKPQTNENRFFCASPRDNMLYSGTDLDNRALRGDEQRLKISMFSH